VRALPLLLLLACDDPAPLVIDLDGPRGTVNAPGPWPVRVFAGGEPATLRVAVGAGDFTSVALALDAQGGYVGRLPDAPVGSVLRYYAVVAGRSEPDPERARQVEVRPTGVLADPAPPAACRLAFRWPTDGLILDSSDDGAPQAGVQITVVVDTNLVDGTAARLDVGGRGYSAAAGAGVLGFSGVTLPEGRVALVVEATPAGGRPCDAAIEVER
jgi:hypothetical protein